MKLYKKVALTLLMLVILYIIVLISTLSGIKNPIKRHAIGKAAYSYIEYNYDDSDDLEIDKALYNFKDNNYYVSISSKTSQDTKFELKYNNKGHFIYDSYNDEVLSLFNTWMRMNDVYTDSLEIIKSYYVIKEDQFINGFLNVEEPTQYFIMDQEDGLKEASKNHGDIMMSYSSNSLDINIFKKELENLKDLCDKHNILFNTASLSLESDGEYLGVLNFKYKDIGSPNMLYLIEENLHKNN